MKKYSLTEIQDFFQKHDGMVNLLEIKIEEISECCSVVSMPLKKMHKNGLDSAHGGAVFCLADIAFGVASAAAGYCSVTAQSSFSYIKAGKISPLIAKCSLINEGKKLMIYSITIHDGNDILLAQGQITGYKISTFEDYLQKLSNKQS